MLQRRWLFIILRCMVTIYLLNFIVSNDSTIHISSSECYHCTDSIGVRTVPVSEITALYDFYESFHGESWLWRTNTAIYGQQWNFTNYPNVNPCDRWQGIICSNISATTAAVSGIVLATYNLSGTFPSSFTNLTYLKTISLSQNQINTTFPAMLCQLQNLTILELTKTEIHGSLPSCLFNNLSKLEILSAMSNSIAGSIPFFTKPESTSLRTIFLLENKLTGSVPSSFQYLTAVELLYLGYNYLHGSIDPLGNLTNLQKVALNNNDFSGTLPELLSNLTDLEYLYLHDNYFVGSIPSSYGQLSRLVYFAASSNFLTGTLPSSFSDCVNMQSFIVSNNYLYGTFSHFFETWTKIKVLALYSNYLSGPLPPNAFNNFPNVTLLLIQENCYSGNLNSNQLNTTILTSLTSLDFSDNYFTGNLPLSLLSEESALTVLTGFRQCFTTSLPSEICHLKNLKVFDLDGMTANCAKAFWPGIQGSPQYAASIPGGIPECLWSLTNLTTLRLSGNGLTGTIPAITSFGNLSTIDISYNSLTGVIPAGLQQWQLLTLLNLENNKFVGNIELMTLYNYQYDDSTSSTTTSASNSPGIELTLAQNRLSGGIPSQLSNAQMIDILDGNLFTCSISDPPPDHDPNNQNYVCGSDLLDYSLYLFLGEGLIIVGIILLLFLFIRFLQNFSEDISHLTKEIKKRRSGEEDMQHRSVSFSRSSSDSATEEDSNRQKWTRQLHSFYRFLLKVNNHNEMKRIFHKYRELKYFYSTEGEVTMLKDTDKSKSANSHSMRSITALPSFSSPQETYFQRTKRTLIIVVLKVLMWRSKVTSTMLSYEKDRRTVLKAAAAAAAAAAAEECQQDREGSVSDLSAVTGLASIIKHKEIRYLYQFLKSLQTLRRVSLVLMFIVAILTSPTFYILKQYFRTYGSQYRWLVSAAFLSGSYPAACIIIFWFFSLWMTLAMIARYVPKYDKESGDAVEYEGEEYDREDGDDSKDEESRSEQSLNATATSTDESLSKTSKTRKLSHTGALISTITQSPSAKALTQQISSTISVFNRFSIWISLTSLILNAAVVIVMKSAFIFLLLSQDTTFTQKVFIELTLSTVDVLWGSVVLPYFISNLPKLSSNTKMVLKTSMLCFNNVLLPILIIIVVDQSCFNGLFVSSATVSESFNFQSCLVSSEFASSATATTMITSSIVNETAVNCFFSIHYASSMSFVPFFNYNYNCYSTVLTSYIPIYLISYLVLMMAIPSVSFFILSRHSSWKIMKLFPRLFFIETDNERELRYYHYRHRKLTLSEDYGDVEQAVANNTKLNAGTLSRSGSLISPKSPRSGGGKGRSSIETIDGDDPRDSTFSVDSLRPSYGVESIIIRTELQDTELPNSFKFFKKVIFFPEFILASAVYHLLVLITYGIMCPELMIVAALLTAITSLVWETLLGRWMMRDETYLGDIIDEKFAGPYTTKLDELCIKVCRSPRKCFALLCYGSATFMGLVVLDIVGDDVGWYEALWGPIVIFIAATILFIYYNYFCNIYADDSVFENKSLYGRPTSTASTASVTVLNPVHSSNHGKGSRAKSADAPNKQPVFEVTEEKKRPASHKLTLQQIKTYRQHQEMLEQGLQQEQQQHHHHSPSRSPSQSIHSPHPPYSLPSPPHHRSASDPAKFESSQDATRKLGISLGFPKSPLHRSNNSSRKKAATATEDEITATTKNSISHNYPTKPSSSSSSNAKDDHFIEMSSIYPPPNY